MTTITLQMWSIIQVRLCLHCDTSMSGCPCFTKVYHELSACLVHGPLLSTLLLDLLRQHLSSIKCDQLPHIQSFQYRCLSPVYVDHPFNVCGREVSSGDTQKSFELWIADRDNNMAVKGTAKVQL